MFLLESPKRQDILRTGFELFSARAYDRVNVPQIVRVAGVTLATFYRYFPTKESLVVAIYKDLWRELEGSLWDLPPEGASPKEQLARLWAKMLRFDADYPDALRFLETHNRTAFVDSAVRGHFGPVPEPLVRLMSQLRKESAVKDIDPLILGGLVWGTFIQAVRLRWSGRIIRTESIFRAAARCSWDAVRPTSS